MSIQDELKKTFDADFPSDDRNEAASFAGAGPEALLRRFFALGYFAGKRKGLAADRFDPMDDYDPRWELVKLVEDLAKARYQSDAPSIPAREGWALSLVNDAQALINAINEKYPRK